MRLSLLGRLDMNLGIVTSPAVLGGKMSLISFACRVVVTALFFIGATPARAQVTNGDFNTGLEGWGLLSNGSSAIFWSPHDAFFPFKLDSGSAAVTAVTTPAGPSAFAYFYTDAALPAAT